MVAFERFKAPSPCAHLSGGRNDVTAGGEDINVSLQKWSRWRRDCREEQAPSYHSAIIWLNYMNEQRCERFSYLVIMLVVTHNYHLAMALLVPRDEQARPAFQRLLMACLRFAYLHLVELRITSSDLGICTLETNRNMTRKEGDPSQEVQTFAPNKGEGGGGIIR